MKELILRITTVMNDDFFYWIGGEIRWPCRTISSTLIIYSEGFKTKDYKIIEYESRCIFMLYSTFYNIIWKRQSLYAGIHIHLLQHVKLLFKLQIEVYFICQNSFHTLKRQKEIMIDSQLSMIDRRWKRFKNVELENDARNTTDDSSFEGMMIACIGRLKNKLCKRKEKSLYSTRKNPFLPRQFIRNREVNVQW